MHKVAYMEWVKLRLRAKYEIGGSGVTPVHIQELPDVLDALDVNDFNLYGYPPLLDQIARRYAVKRSQVVTTQGCSMANYLACAVLLERGDELLVEKPAYEPLLAIPRLLGAKVIRFERPFRQGFGIDLNDLAARLTPRTRLVILTNMHNPSGVLTGEEELREIGRMARRVKARVLVDEVYLEFLFEQPPHSAVHLGPQFVVTSSLTKAYGLDGLRCGWAIATPPLAKAMWRLQDFFGVNGAIPAEKMSVAAFQQIHRLAARTQQILHDNRPLVDRFMDDHAEQLDWVPPQAGPVCFPRLRHGSVNALAERMRRDFQTGIIPGRFFEMPRHFRLGMGGVTAELKKGLNGLDQALR